MAQPKTSSLTVRLTDEQRARLEAAANIGPYRVSITEIVTRGIELASCELERMKKSAEADS